MMPSMTVSQVWYVYGVVPASFSTATAPAGLDDAPVQLRGSDDGGPAALVSVLDGDRYAPVALEATSGDVEWLSRGPSRTIACSHGRATAERSFRCRCSRCSRAATPCERCCATAGTSCHWRSFGCP